MTDKEALKRVKKLFELYVKDEPFSEHRLYAEAINMTVEALEKQIPKKPLNIEDKYLGCPCCYGLLMVRWIKYPTNPVPLESGRNYCENCGQRIDWKGEE